MTNNDIKYTKIMLFKFTKMPYGIFVKIKIVKM